jgi:hypothetical protein
MLTMKLRELTKVEAEKDSIANEEDSETAT